MELSLLEIEPRPIYHEVRFFSLFTKFVLATNYLDIRSTEILSTPTAVNEDVIFVITASYIKCE